MLIQSQTFTSCNFLLENVQTKRFRIPIKLPHISRSLPTHDDLTCLSHWSIKNEKTKKFLTHWPSKQQCFDRRLTQSLWTTSVQTWSRIKHNHRPRFDAHPKSDFHHLHRLFRASGNKTLHDYDNTTMDLWIPPDSRRFDVSFALIDQKRKNKKVSHSFTLQMAMFW